MSDVPPKQPVTGTDSVRMNTGAALPHYQGANADPEPVPVTPASSRAGADMSASAALVSMHNAASQAGGDAFPVLKAFQDYLESERQRARRRMTTLSVVFAVVIVAVIGAFTLIWFSTMKGMQETNNQLLDVALKKATAEPPQPVVVQPPPQPSAAEITKTIAEALSKAQSDQSAAFAKTLEGLNASLESMRRDNAEMRAEIEREKAAAAKAAAERAAAEKAAAERAVAEEKARAAKEQAQRIAAQKAAEQKAAAEKEVAAKAAAAKAAAQPDKNASTTAPPATTTESAATTAKQTPPPPPKPAELQIPKYDAPPPPTGFSQDIMAVRLQKESRPISWRVYVPLRTE